MKTRSPRPLMLGVLLVTFVGLPVVGFADNKPPGLGGMKLQALQELHEAGMDKYIGQFQPAHERRVNLERGRLLRLDAPQDLAAFS